ncbi:MAG: hypothetical protein JSS81_04075 [Acidobacteria bacterium]|nr:hypothetical protein [Acidobacteriota bacterium]
MSKICLAMLLTAFLYAAGAPEAAACTCRGRPAGPGVETCGYYWGAENVFIGLAESVVVENDLMKATFAVEKTIRGTPGEKVEIWTSRSTASCGYPFKQGGRYFVYGRRSGDGKFHEHLCGPTVRLDDAADDLEYVKEIEAGKTGTRIYGSIYEDVQKSSRDPRTLGKLAGIEVTIQSVRRKKIRFKTLTDAQGKYLFKEIPPDDYRVTAKLPAGLRELFTRADLTEHLVGVSLENRRCGGADFVTTRQGAVAGKMIGPDGRAAPQVFLSLLPLDERDQIIRDYPPVDGVWADQLTGDFFFRIVPPGRYLLAVNPANCPLAPTHDVLRRLGLEFGRTFYDGAADRKNARIVTVFESGKLDVGSFKLPAPLAERWFSGIVYDAGRRPLAGATVFLLPAETSRCSYSGNVGEVKTDADGRFRLRGFETYDYRIRAYNEKNRQPEGRLFSKLRELPASGNADNLELTVDAPY